MPQIDAAKGILGGLTGKSPDTQSVYGSGGSRGINQVNDSPYRPNDIIPGQSDAPNTVGFGEMQEANSYEDFMNEDVEQLDEAVMDTEYETGGMSNAAWIDLGRRCYDTGRTFYRQGYQTQHINSSYLFKSQHEPNSKYYDPAYKNRSRIFRPLTRMAARSWEADVQSALFMNDDYMHIGARNVEDPESAKAAAVLKELVNLRLDKNWYQICIGAAQDAFINGPVIGKVYWWHEVVAESRQTSRIDEFGMPAIDTIVDTKTIRDEPCIELILPENFMYDPTAKWFDVVGTAEYFVHRKMMSVEAVQIRMNAGEWNMLPLDQILTCRWAMEDDAVQQSKRGQGKPDPVNNDNADRQYECVMVNEVFVRRGGIWYVYHMMGVNFLLEQPMHLEDKYAFGRLPFVYGNAMIESHNNAPDSKAHIGRELQVAVNEVANSRMDNVRLAMNKRMLAKRGASIDLASLTRSSPGGVTFTGDPATDVVPFEVSDVTQSSYEEAQRLTMEMNELQGTFSGQAVANNREMNETVGGMQLLSSSATKVNDYDIRTFVKTWVRPVLELFMLCEQYYESDELIMELAVNNAAYFPRLKVEDLSDDLMTKQLELKVDVGLGATDPVQRVNTLLYGIGQVAALPGMAEKMDVKAVGSSIFAALGQGDGSKFFPNLAKNYVEEQAAPPQPDPLVLAAQEEAKGRIQAEQIRAEAENARLQAELMAQTELKKFETESKSRIEMLKMALSSENLGKQQQLDILKALLDNETKLRIAEGQDKTKRQTTVLQQGSALQQQAMNSAAGIAEARTPTQSEIANETRQQPSFPTAEQ